MDSNMTPADFQKDPRQSSPQHPSSADYCAEAVVVEHQSVADDVPSWPSPAAAISPSPSIEALDDFENKTLEEVQDALRQVASTWSDFAVATSRPTPPSKQLLEEDQLMPDFTVGEELPLTKIGCVDLVRFDYASTGVLKGNLLLAKLRAIQDWQLLPPWQLGTIQDICPVWSGLLRIDGVKPPAALLRFNARHGLGNDPAAPIKWSTRLDKAVAEVQALTGVQCYPTQTHGGMMALNTFYLCAVADFPEDYLSRLWNHLRFLGNQRPPERLPLKGYAHSAHKIAVKLMHTDRRFMLPPSTPRLVLARAAVKLRQAVRHALTSTEQRAASARVKSKRAQHRSKARDDKYTQTDPTIGDRVSDYLSRSVAAMIPEGFLNQVMARVAGSINATVQEKVKSFLTDSLTITRVVNAVMMIRSAISGDADAFQIHVVYFASLWSGEFAGWALGNSTQNPAEAATLVTRVFSKFFTFFGMPDTPSFTKSLQQFNQAALAMRNMSGFFDYAIKCMQGMVSAISLHFTGTDPFSERRTKLQGSLMKFSMRFAEYGSLGSSADGVQLLQLHREMLAFMSSLDRTEKTIFGTLHAKVMALLPSAQCKVAAIGDRIAPVTVLSPGDPGIGKSTWHSELVCHLPVPDGGECRVWTVPPSSLYDCGHDNKAVVVKMDDWLTNDVDENRYADIARLMAWSNTCTAQMNMAEVDQKASHFFTHPYLLMSTNRPNITQPQSGLVLIDAVYRRIDLLATPSLDSDHCYLFGGSYYKSVVAMGSLKYKRATYEELEALGIHRQHWAPLRGPPLKLTTREFARVMANIRASKIKHHNDLKTAREAIERIALPDVYPEMVPQSSFKCAPPARNTKLSPKFLTKNYSGYNPEHFGIFATEAEHHFLIQENARAVSEYFDMDDLTLEIRTPQLGLATIAYMYENLNEMVIGDMLFQAIQSNWAQNKRAVEAAYQALFTAVPSLRCVDDFIDAASDEEEGMTPVSPPLDQIPDAPPFPHDIFRAPPPSYPPPTRPTGPVGVLPSASDDDDDEGEDPQTHGDPPEDVPSWEKASYDAMDCVGEMCQEHTLITSQQLIHYINYGGIIPDLPPHVIEAVLPGLQTEGLDSEQRGRVGILTNLTSPQRERLEELRAIYVRPSTKWALVGLSIAALSAAVIVYKLMHCVAGSETQSRSTGGLQSRPRPAKVNVIRAQSASTHGGPPPNEGIANCMQKFVSPVRLRVGRGDKEWFGSANGIWIRSGIIMLPGHTAFTVGLEHPTGGEFEDDAAVSMDFSVARDGRIEEYFSRDVVVYYYYPDSDVLLLKVDLDGVPPLPFLLARGILLAANQVQNIRKTTPVYRVEHNFRGKAAVFVYSSGVIGDSGVTSDFAWHNIPDTLLTEEFKAAMGRTSRPFTWKNKEYRKQADAVQVKITYPARIGYDIRSELGQCGFPVVSGSHFLGFHVMGQGHSWGACNVITREKLEEWSNVFERYNLPARGNGCEPLDPSLNTAHGLSVVGTYHSPFTGKLITKSPYATPAHKKGLTQLVIDGEPVPNNKAPAPTRYPTKKGAIDPVDQALSKIVTDERVPATTTFTAAAMDRLKRDYTPQHYEELTVDAAVLRNEHPGPYTRDGTGRMILSTGAGVPLSTVPGKPSKRHHVHIMDGQVLMSPELKQTHAKLSENLDKGHTSPPFVAVLKHNETRATEKVRLAKARVIFGSSFDWSILGRQLLLPALEYLASKCETHPVSVGIDLHGHGAKALYDRLLQGEELLAGDYSGFDLTRRQTYALAAIEFLVWLCPDVDEVRLRSYLHNMVDPTILLEGSLVRPGTSPSGAIGTSEFNSIVNMFTLYEVIGQTLLANGFTLEAAIEALDEIDFMTYGDDWDAASPLPKAQVNWSILPKIALEKCGVTMTRADKKLDLPFGPLPIEDITFLGRNFVPTDSRLGLVQAPRSVEDILQSLYWVTSHDPAHWSDLYQSIATELSHHGQAVFENVLPQVFHQLPASAKSRMQTIRGEWTFHNVMISRMKSYHTTPKTWDYHPVAPVDPTTGGVTHTDGLSTAPAVQGHSHFLPTTKNTFPTQSATPTKKSDRILILYNPVSGQGDARGYAYDIQHLLDDENLNSTVLATDPETFETDILPYYAAPLVFVLGGDGTARMAINAFPPNTRFGFVGLGTGNAMMKLIDPLAGSVDSVVKRIISAYLKSTLHSLPSLDVRYDTHTTRALSHVGAGLPAVVARDAEPLRGSSRSSSVYAKVGAQKLLGNELAYSGHFTAESYQNHSGVFSSAMWTLGADLGGYKIVDDIPGENFAVVVNKTHTALGVLINGIALMRGKTLSKLSSGVSHICNDSDVTFDTLTPLMVDGDYLTECEYVSVTLGKDVFFYYDYDGPVCQSAPGSADDVLLAASAPSVVAQQEQITVEDAAPAVEDIAPEVSDQPLPGTGGIEFRPQPLGVRIKTSVNTDFALNSATTFGTTIGSFGIWAVLMSDPYYANFFLTYRFASVDALKVTVTLPAGRGAAVTLLPVQRVLQEYSANPPSRIYDQASLMVATAFRPLKDSWARPPSGDDPGNAIGHVSCCDGTTTFDVELFGDRLTFDAFSTHSTDTVVDLVALSTLIAQNGPADEIHLPVIVEPVNLRFHGIGDPRTHGDPDEGAQKTLRASHTFGTKRHLPAVSLVRSDPQLALVGGSETKIVVPQNRLEVEATPPISSNNCMGDCTLRDMMQYHQAILFNTFGPVATMEVKVSPTTYYGHGGSTTINKQYSVCQVAMMQCKQFRADMVMQVVITAPPFTRGAMLVQVLPGVADSASMLTNSERVLQSQVINVEGTTVFNVRVPWCFQFPSCRTINLGARSLEQLAGLVRFSWSSPPVDGGAGTPVPNILITRAYENVEMYGFVNYSRTAQGHPGLGRDITDVKLKDLLAITHDMWEINYFPVPQQTKTSNGYAMVNYVSPTPHRALRAGADNLPVPWLDGSIFCWPCFLEVYENSLLPGEPVPHSISRYNGLFGLYANMFQASRCNLVLTFTLSGVDADKGYFEITPLTSFASTNASTWPMGPSTAREDYPAIVTLETMARSNMPVYLSGNNSVSVPVYYDLNRFMQNYDVGTSAAPSTGSPWQGLRNATPVSIVWRFNSQSAAQATPYQVLDLRLTCAMSLGEDSEFYGFRGVGIMDDPTIYIPPP